MTIKEAKTLCKGDIVQQMTRCNRAGRNTNGFPCEVVEVFTV